MKASFLIMQKKLNICCCFLIYLGLNAILSSLMMVEQIGMFLSKEILIDFHLKTRNFPVQIIAIMMISNQYFLVVTIILTSGSLEQKTRLLRELARSRWITRKN